MKRVLLLVALALLFLSCARADEQVSAVQTRLKTLGLYEGEVDGIYGDGTKYAVERLVAYLRAFGQELTPQDAIQSLLKGEVSPYAANARKGDASETVIRIQRRLADLGYLPFKADGSFGENTLRALRIFQYYSQIEPTGEADRETQLTLFSDRAYEAAYKALKNGDRGDEVERLQQRLALLGFFTGDIDRQYGQATVQGVKAFQTYVLSSGAYSLDNRLAALDGMADSLTQQLLFSEDFNVARTSLVRGDSGQEVYRLQRRLAALGYLADEADGGYGDRTEAAVAEFKKAVSIKGVEGADVETQKAMYSASAPEAVKPYRVEIDISQQKLFVYAKDDSGEYTKLVSTMACSTGPDAVPGEYRLLTRPARKLQKRGNDYLRYVYQLDLNLTISSIPYYDEDSFDKKRLDSLGSPMDEGGVMLSLQNARLIWEKCPARTTVAIVE
ncbi:MAG: peptidoglycan-binding protein [Clostridia bacterium]|nr:peptidoglycan-binding protein [Clostridia bacterium]